ncbi:nuclear transport factor 2 family protein [Metasolibacillus meyeri]|uniref:Nuclear transport factor 2 family protein n=1 Tax=Metasolibacillus meyeri TaxID=1071052 RepID=A0AAW9NXH9_9BACL|nr:nuclear transport factor 2 family protein [Metasolibacillus meyeri]MEC1180854.1 nuclear transport factor 2 family protein [Metasolibacillus meyeri]
MKKWLIMLMLVLTLAACGNTEEPLNAEQTAEIIEKGTVGFEMLGNEITAAENVPNDEREKIIAVFNEYITAFNEEDIERYSATLSKNATGFDYGKDLVEAQNAFDAYTINRQASDITILKYDDNEAQVYANLEIDMVEDETGTELSSKGRQVTVLVKEGEAWKVTSVFYIGNE